MATALLPPESPDLVPEASSAEDGCVLLYLASGSWLWEVLVSQQADFSSD